MDVALSNLPEVTCPEQGLGWAISSSSCRNEHYIAWDLNMQHLSRVSWQGNEVAASLG